MYTRRAMGGGAMRDGVPGAVSTTECRSGEAMIRFAFYYDRGEDDVDPTLAAIEECFSARPSTASRIRKPLRWICAWSALRASKRFRITTSRLGLSPPGVVSCTKPGGQNHRPRANRSVGTLVLYVFFIL